MDRLDLSLLKIGADFCDNIDVLCKKCGNHTSECKCPSEIKGRERNSYLIWIKEQKKSGKDVSICGIFYEKGEILEGILKKIKKNLACGGGIKREGEGYLLEIQGRHSEKLKAFLKQEKFKFKK